MAGDMGKRKCQGVAEPRAFRAADFLAPETFPVSPGRARVGSGEMRPHEHRHAIPFVRPGKGLGEEKRNRLEFVNL